jgi:preprotein translocase subunit YajC
MRCNTLNTFFLAQSAAGMNNMFMIIAMIAIFVFFYFLNDQATKEATTRTDEDDV